MTESTPLLELKDLEKHFDRSSGIVDSLIGRENPPVQAVDGVSMSLKENDSKAVIGESGCGKTTLLLTLMGLHEHTGGKLLYKGNDVSDFSKKEWKEFRRNVQIIFQDPFNSLDPKQTVEEALKEPLNIHGIENKDERVRNILQQVELAPAEKYLNRKPGQLSGGEKQRISIARGLILEPEVILADEPVSMLDVSTQASVLRMLKRLIKDLDVAMLYISHDISTVSYVSDEINVMYLGRIVERAPTESLLNDPSHPYSEALISAIPIPDPHHNRKRTDIDGSPRDPVGMDEGCRFRDRCPERMDICDKTPEMTDIEEAHQAACHLYYDHEARVEANGHMSEVAPDADLSSTTPGSGGEQ